MSNNRGKPIRANPATIKIRPRSQIEIKANRGNALLFWVYLAICGLIAGAMLYAGQYILHLYRGINP